MFPNSWKIDKKLSGIKSFTQLQLFCFAKTNILKGFQSNLKQLIVFSAWQSSNNRQVPCFCRLCLARERWHWCRGGEERGTCALQQLPAAQVSWATLLSNVNFRVPWWTQVIEKETSVFYTLSMSIQSCIFFFIASVTITVGHLQRWSSVASGTNHSLQHRDKKNITNSLSKRIIVANL